MASQTKLKNAILKALAYSDIFHYPLSFYQLALYLGVEKTSRRNFEKALKALKKAKKISQESGKYYLFRHKTVDWSKKQKETQKRLEKAKKILEPILKIPWIRLLAITGDLAASNPEKKGDIDIFVITQNKRTWITRLFVVLYLKATGNYFQEKNSQNKICPNLFVSKNAMKWEKKQQNFFIASEIIRMQPLKNEKEVYFEFLTENNWIKEHFPNFGWEKKQYKKKANPGVLDLVEKIAYWGQRKYMQKKVTKEKVSPVLIHFNKNDKSGEILRKYSKTLSNIG